MWWLDTHQMMHEEVRHLPHAVERSARVLLIEQPHQFATGARFVFVNGQLAVENGQVTDKLAGRALRHNSTRQEP